MTLVLPPSSFQPRPAVDEPLLAVACPSCHGALSVTTSLAGAAARCPLCSRPFLVPVPGPAWQPLPDLPQEPAVPRVRGELEFEEPVPTLASGDGLIELRRLTPEEKATRRARRNLIMLLAGVLVLMTIVLVLGTKRTRK